MNVLDLVADLFARELCHDSPSVSRAESRTNKGSSPNSPLSPPLVVDVRSDDPLVLAAVHELHVDPTLVRAVKADEQLDGRYRIAVACRLNDGADQVATANNIAASWERIVEAIHRAGYDYREQFEERAGIREFDGLQSRAEAEASALLETIQKVAKA